MSKEVDDLKIKVASLEGELTKLRIQEAEKRGRDRMIGIIVAAILSFSQALLLINLTQYREQASQTHISPSATTTEGELSASDENISRTCTDEQSEVTKET